MQDSLLAADVNLGPHPFGLGFPIGEECRVMAEEEKPQVVPKTEKSRKKAQKYVPLPRNRATENAMLEIFEHGTERELMQYLRANGLKDENPRFGQIVKLFRERGPRRF